MKVGITVWGKRISPVFDSASTVLLVESDGSRFLQRKFVTCPSKEPSEMVRLLLNSGVEVLITGAISNEAAALLELGGIELLSFIAGRADRVLEEYIDGRSITEYRMPGCRCAGPSGRGSRKRCRNGR